VEVGDDGYLKSADMWALHDVKSDGDTILQTPGIKHREIACSENFEVLEIVSPANFETRVVEAPRVKAQAAE